jgi:3-hydroxybutyryl-CoA dehydratase
MSTSTPVVAIEAGTHFASTPAMMTRERMRWYCDALETSASQSGEFIVADPTIHTDEAYAKAQGLPGIIADGMISTNYISSLLYHHFGVAYLAGGELTTKFIRPVYEDDILSAHALVTGLDDDGYTVDVWVETEDGQKVTVGTAKAPLTGER